MDSTLSLFQKRLKQRDIRPRLRITLLAATGQLLIQGGRLSTAFSYCREAHSLALEYLPREDVISAYAHAGYGCYLSFFEVPALAIDPLRASLPGLETLYKKHRRKGSAGLSIVGRYLRSTVELNLMEEGYATYEQLLRAAKNEPYAHFADTYNNFGYFLQQAGYHERAIKEFDRGVREFPESPTYRDSFALVNILETKSHSLVAIGEIDRALEHLENAYRVRREIGATKFAMQALNYLLSYLIEAGRYREAMDFFRSEERYVEQVLTPRKVTYKLYKQLGILHRHFGQEESAKKYFNAYYAFATEKVLPVAEASAKTPQDLSEYVHLQSVAYEQALRISQLEAEQINKELQARNFGLLALAMLMGFLAFWGLTKYRKRQRDELERKRSEMDRRRILELENNNLKFSLTSQEKDIKRLAADNRLRTQLKKDLLKKIEAINALPVTEGSLRLDKLKRELSQTIVDQESISNLQDQINTINTAFEERLRMRIPGISAQEVKYCSLLRLDMDNQQIAQVLNKSDATIRSYKYRINKKAGITGKGDLRALVLEL